MSTVKEPPDPPAISEEDDRMIQSDWAGAASRAVQQLRTQMQQNKEYTNVMYTDDDTGPYRVYLELRNKDGIHRINKFSVGSTLRKLDNYRQCITDMKQVGRNRIMVFFSNYGKANALVEEINISTTSIYKAYVPVHLISVTGIVDGVPADISEEEILDELESEVPIISVKRLTRFVDGERIPANRISVRFRARELPDRIRLFCCCSRVRPFGQRLIACGKCLRFNHNEERCRGNRRCKNCGEQHEKEEEFNQCRNKKKCAYCKSEKHTMEDENCPEKVRQQNIKKLMAKTATTFAEAKECFPHRSQNTYAVLEEMNDFPTLVESYAATQHGESLRQQWQRTNQVRERITAAVRTYQNVQRKPTKTGSKRVRKEDDDELTTNAMKTTEERDRILRSVPSGTKDGVALNNRVAANEKEKWEHYMREARNRAEWTANQATKSTVMTFYTDFLGQLGNQEEIKSKFKQCTQKYFNLTNTVITKTNNTE